MKTISAEEFLANYKKQVGVRLTKDLTPTQITDFGIKFAKLHTKEALEVAANSIECYPSEKNTIINCYPETYIK